MFTPKSKTVFMLDYHQLDKIATDAYGHGYSTLDGLYDDFKNDMDKDMGEIDGDGFWDIDYQERFDEWKDTESDEYGRDSNSPHPSDMLNFLVRDGHLPAGNYLLAISW